MSKAVISPFQIPNVRLFIIFRVLFNARFYYPVFSILFLDFGLTLSQFAILNAVWAATIVLCEVPSGALADSFGRRNLLVFAGSLMVVEIALWAFVPRGNLELLFWASAAWLRQRPAAPTKPWPTTVCNNKVTVPIGVGCWNDRSRFSRPASSSP
jgi:MFS family permease